MKFKVASSILAIFTLIGLGIVIFSDFESTASRLICLALYVLIPAYGAYGIFIRSRRAIFVSVAFFISQSIRMVDSESIIPHIAPITVSVPFGDFSNGQGYLIDYFAIVMVVFLIWLLKGLMTPNKSSN
ncbi:hypothetical protein Q4575_07260 [Psychrosphaera sp. 1_MG-2023]|uniref:hypothetical protein n=1 Tax=Psychrosphaera sp. 1_MG-2023 TaxID=3062643 RepID=UPI0026E3E68F|nr:hypothetical protein [Psychrosphaera sp. 1_MG-2023]MDO6719191.1 hypothetical protein [Psychrosphaera sp. 1_MG-2023]